MGMRNPQLRWFAGVEKSSPVGGLEVASSWWLNQPISKTYLSKWESSAVYRGEIKNILKPPSRKSLPNFEVPNLITQLPQD